MLGYWYSYYRNALIVPIMRCRQSGQSLMLSLHGSQQIRCRHGRNNTPTLWSMQTLHVILLFSVSFCLRNSSTSYVTSGSITAVSTLAWVSVLNVSGLSRPATTPCPSMLHILVISSLLCVLSSSLKIVSNSSSESNDSPAGKHKTVFAFLHSRCA